MSDKDKDLAPLEAELVAKGGRKWVKANMIRYYFEIDPALFGWVVERYKTGAVKSAKFNGNKISNNKADAALRELNRAKFWYDVVFSDFYSEGLSVEQFEAMKQEVLK